MNFRMHELRKNLGLTQEDIAQKLRTTKRIVGAWERQETPIPLSDACDLCDLLKCSLDELAGRPRLTGFEDPLQQQLNEDYETLDDAAKDMAAAAVRGIADTCARAARAAGPEADQRTA